MLQEQLKIVLKNNFALNESKPKKNNGKNNIANPTSPKGMKAFTPTVYWKLLN